MEFNITGITTASTLGNGFMAATAKGVYAVVSMTVKNVSSNSLPLPSCVLEDGERVAFEVGGAVVGMHDSHRSITRTLRMAVGCGVSDVAHHDGQHVDRSIVVDYSALWCASQANAVAGRDEYAGPTRRTRALRRRRGTRSTGWVDHRS